MPYYTGNGDNDEEKINLGEKKCIEGSSFFRDFRCCCLLRLHFLCFFCVVRFQYFFFLLFPEFLKNSSCDSSCLEKTSVSNGSVNCNCPSYHLRDSKIFLPSVWWSWSSVCLARRSTENENFKLITKFLSKSVGILLSHKSTQPSVNKFVKIYISLMNNLVHCTSFHTGDLRVFLGSGSLSSSSLCLQGR